VPAKIATTTGTTFTDTTVTAGQAYDYQVVARDAAGNLSAPSNKVTVTAVGGTSTLTFSPVADSSVKQASPSTNYGTSASLNSDSGSGVAMESYVRFTVSGVGSATVRSAKLRLYVPSDATADGPGIYACTASACSTWTESGITWNTRPARATTATAETGRISAGTWVEYDVTPLVHGDGTYTLVIGPTPTTDGVNFSSRQATTNRPQLVITR
jgi:chitodextrinase